MTQVRVPGEAGAQVRLSTGEGTAHQCLSHPSTGAQPSQGGWLPTPGASAAVCPVRSVLY